VPQDKVVTVDLSRQVLERWPEGKRKRIDETRLKTILVRIQEFWRALYSSGILYSVCVKAAEDPNGLEAQALARKGIPIPKWIIERFGAPQTAS
jgi:hypothetical protein